MVAVVLHIRLDDDEIDGVIEEGPRRIPRDDLIGSRVERGAELLIDLAARAIEELVELGVSVKRAVLGVHRMDRFTAEEYIEKIRRVGEVHHPAGDEHRHGLLFRCLDEIGREGDLLEAYRDADFGEIALPKLREVS